METRLYTIHVESLDGTSHFSYKTRLQAMTAAEADEMRAAARDYGIQSNRIRFIDSTLGIYYRTDAANYLGGAAMYDFCSIPFASPTLADGWDVSGVNTIIELFPFVDADLTARFRGLPITSSDENYQYHTFRWYAQAKAGEVQHKFSAIFRDWAPGKGGGCTISPNTGAPDSEADTFPLYCFGGGSLSSYNTVYSNTYSGLLIIDDAGDIAGYSAGNNTSYPSGYMSSTPRFGLYAGSAAHPFNVLTGNLNLMAMWQLASFATVASYDPYAGAGTSEPDLGDGTMDFNSTDIPMAGLPTIGAMDTGFIGLYNPSAGQLKSLANYMWSGAFDIDNLKKLFADPMDCILGLHIIPTISGHPASTSATLMVGNVSTGLSMPAVTEQYYELDCGTISIPPKWGAYLDYSPYTKLSLYLPYIGFVDISPDDCMRGSIRVKYTVDVLSGTCTAQVYCVSNRGRDGHTLYIYNGSCSCECPVTEGQYKTGALGVLEVAAGIGQIGSGNVLGGLGQTFSAVQSMIKPEVKRSGGFGGSAGLMAIQYPYLILTVPHMCIPGDQNTYIGYPSFVTKTIGELSGYTQIEVTHLRDMSCSQEEADEIISLLGEGVIF